MINIYFYHFNISLELGCSLFLDIDMDINGTRAPPTATDLLDLPDYAGRDFLEASSGGLSFTAQEPDFCCSVAVVALVVVVDCILLYFTVLYLKVVRKLACASIPH